MQPGRLTPIEVQRIIKNKRFGPHSDGGNLYLVGSETFEFGIGFIEDDDDGSAAMACLLNGVEPRMKIGRSGLGHVGAKRHRLAFITHDAQHKALRQLTSRGTFLFKRNCALVLGSDRSASACSLAANARHDFS